MKKNEYYLDAIRKGDQTHNQNGLWERSNPAFFCLTSQVDKRTSFRESLQCFTTRKGKLVKPIQNEATNVQ